MSAPIQPPKGKTLFQVSPAYSLPRRAAIAVRSLRGWRRHGTAAALGAVAAGSLPPLNLVFLLLIAFPGLVWLSDGSRRRWDAFGIGFWFGFGYFVPGLYWTTVAMFTDIGRFWWAVPFALVGLPIFLSLYTGLAVLATYLTGARGVSRILVFGIAWGIGEWLRGHFLTGFPWNLVGYAWAGSLPGLLPVLQSVSLFGIYGLSLLTVTVASLPALIGDEPSSVLAGAGGRWPLAGEGVGRSLALAGGALLFLALGIFGTVRLSRDDQAITPGITIRLVQPNIAQTMKWDPQQARANFNHLLQLSSAPSATRLSAVVWPEAAASFIMDQHAEAREAIASVAPPGGLMLVGSLRGTIVDGFPKELWNTLFAIDGDAKVVATFDKYHLTPFGEYMPLERWLPLQSLAAGSSSFSSGIGARSLALPGLPPVSAMICYEAVFPGDVVDERHRPAWLLNITNDAWFGNSSGPFQHFEQSRVRAIEEGLPLLRAANTGISGVVDPYGRVLQRLGLARSGLIDAALPLALPPTPYSRLGDAAPAAVAAILGLLALAFRPRREITPSSG